MFAGLYTVTGATIFGKRASPDVLGDQVVERILFLFCFWLRFGDQSFGMYRTHVGGTVPGLRHEVRERPEGYALQVGPQILVWCLGVGVWC